MGSEVLPNQAAIDRACVAEARTDVVLAVIAGVAGLAAAVYAVLLSRRTRVRAGQR
jgi:1-deoxy-D-xylulose 5-phosphate reductoisomerase